MNFKNNKKFYAIWSKGNALHSKASNLLGIGYPELIVLYALKTAETQIQKDISRGLDYLNQP